MTGQIYPFKKYQAALNDFVFFDFAPALNSLAHTAFITQCCDRHRGIGADGVVYLYSSNQKDWEWQFFNRDGSREDLCGNAARCVCSALIEKSKDLSKSIFWKGSLGVFEGKSLSPKIFEVSWPIANAKVQSVSDELLDDASVLNDFGLAMIQLIQVGVPHLVLLCFEEWSIEHRITTSPQLRAHPSLGATGANVTWVSLKNNNCVTFERGVEAETEACGSGAMAAFLAVEHWRKTNNKTALSSQDFHFPGGTLSVRRDETQAHKFWLKGEAIKVFDGTWEF